MTQRPTGRPTTLATNGIVATPHYLASQAGLRVLQDGGNAVDAAIAANAVLQVVYSHNTHLGGDLFAIVWDPKTRELQGLNASGTAASGETIERMHELGHTTMPERGAHAVTVPGTAAGWDELHTRYGSLDMGTLLSAAINYARNGAPITAKFANALQTLQPLLAQDPGARDVFCVGERRVGDLLRQPAFAATLERLGREGRNGFYTGPVADDIVSTLGSYGSGITHEDLAGYAPEWVTPLRVPYRGFELVQLPPNTVGVTTLLMAGIAEGWPVSDLGHITGAGIHAYVGAKQRAFDERDRWVADPRFADIPLERFTSRAAADAQRASIDLERVSASPGLPNQDGDTIYLCVVDRDGLAVSLIQSVYMGFGSCVLAPKSGVLFQNRGAAFSLDPAHPNALAPGKRPKHTLAPAMLLRDGQPDVVFGCMGGDGQTQTHLQLLLGLVDFGLDPQQAIETPRWRDFVDAAGDALLFVEPGVGPDTIADLERRGHRVEVRPHWDEAMGHAQMIRIDRARGVLAGGADPRGDGIAAGW
jgi:gamma-glutamyltranspeptidase/glutathione hydrolase